MGETHEVLIQLKAKFKALKNIENKINELAKSGKKIITGATQAIPKVVAMTSSPGTGPAGAPSLGGGPTGGGSGPSGGGTPAASGGGGSGGEQFWGRRLWYWRFIYRRVSFKFTLSKSFIHNFLAMFIPDIF